MKVMHCCLAAFYIDEFSYQENILPRVHRDLGCEVEIVASTETYKNGVSLEYTEPSSYLSGDSIRVTRLPYVSWLPDRLARKLRIYEGLLEELERFRPDVIFLHDCQFLSVKTIEKYSREHCVTVYVDCHTDTINSARTFVSRQFLHRIIYRWCANRINRVARKFYATLPLRGDFLRDVYSVPPDKIKLLPFGVDDARVPYARREEIRAEIRSNLRISASELVFVTGGKIDSRKGIDVLLQTFTDLASAGELPKVTLLVFGRVDTSLEERLAPLLSHVSVRWVGWVPADQIFRYLWASDVAIFPGTHSVLWEEACGLGVPCIFRRWPGMHHLDVGGNCLFLENADQEELTGMFLSLLQDSTKLASLSLSALSRGPRFFSYSSVGRISLELEPNVYALDLPVVN